ncbi:MAG: FAD:protein FMN transferase [bacterium]|jgi:thiamine biosynthesis lipoprotein
MDSRRRRKGYLVGVILLALLAGCRGRDHGADKPQAVARTGFMMDTIFEITAYGPAGEALQAATAALDEVRRLEDLLSAHIAMSDVARINAAAGQDAVPVSPETIWLLEQSLAFSARTEGAFDVTVKPLIDVWGIGKKEDYIPTPDEVAAALALIGYHRVEIDSAAKTVFLPEAGMGIDLGAVAKGYAVDRAAAVLQEKGVSAGIVNGGGNIRVLGQKPDGSDWRIAVRDPRIEGGTAVVLSLADKAIATSGDYERYFIKDNQRYHHLFDPATGEPAAGGIISATVVADSAMEADILSTAVFVLGPDDGLAAVGQMEAADAFIIRSDGSTVESPGLADKLQRVENSSSGNNSN